MSTTHNQQATADEKEKRRTESNMNSVAPSSSGTMMKRHDTFTAASHPKVC